MKKSVLAATSFVLILMPLVASAQSATFDKNHPRRAEVIHRDKNEKAKNNAAAVNGKITNHQAKKLDREDNHIRNQERRDAAKNGGHITKAEQKHLNREENGVNAQRRHDEVKDGTAH